MISRQNGHRQDLRTAEAVIPKADGENSGVRQRWRAIARRLLAAVGALLVLLLGLTPTGCYVSRAAWEEARILARRKPINELVAREGTEPVLRAKLELVMKAREFAIDSLGLNAGESFTTYSRLDRDTLVLVVSAAYPDRLELKTWSFPIVGSFPYKGFFDFDEALNTAERLQSEGFDVSVGASSAFSTLGWFNDPLVSTTVRQDSVTLVNTILHELSHNTYFAKGEVAFNESFASFVGGRGAIKFFQSAGSTALTQRAEDDWHDELIMGAFWERTSREIDSVFALLPDSARSERIAARNAVYKAAQLRLVDSIAPLLRTYPTGWAARVKLNNAVLLARRVYANRLDRFDSVYAASGGNLRLAISRIVAMHRDSISRK